MKKSGYRGMTCVMFLTLWSVTASAEQLTILTEEWPPINFSQDGKPTGLAVDVVQEILRRLNMTEPIEIVPWARGWKMVTEQPNVALFSMTRTPTREAMFTLVGPLVFGTTDLYAKRGSGITLKNLDEAKQAGVIGVYRSSVEEQFLQEAGFTNLETVSSPDLNAKKLMKGRIQLWCNANLTVRQLLQDVEFSMDDVEKVLTIRQNALYIAFSQGTAPNMIRQWVQTLEKMHADGTFAEMYEKWLPGETPPDTVEQIGLSQ